MERQEMKEKIKSYFKENHHSLQKEMLTLLSEMVAKKTVNVPSNKLANFDYLTMRGEEWQVGEIVKREFEQWGLRTKVAERVKGRMNVIGYVGRNEDQNKKLFMACHMDIVPPGQGWDTDPFVMTEKDGKVYGRGVLDNKGPLVSSMLAAKVMKTVLGDEALSGELQVAGMADEEASDPDGIDYGIHFLMEEKHIDPTYAIIPDIGENMLKIDVAEKGRVVVTVIAKGVQAHGSTPHLGVNAIHKMARFLTLLEEHTLTYDEDPILKEPTVNVGEIHGGAAANIVPNECTCDIDFRIVAGQTPDGVLGELKELAAKVADDFEFNVASATTPHSINPENILVKSIQENSETFGMRPVPFGLGGGTFAKGMNQHGILAVGFGPGDDTAFHVANEYVEIKQLMIFAELICLVALDLVA